MSDPLMQGTDAPADDEELALSFYDGDDSVLSQHLDFKQSAARLYDAKGIDEAGQRAHMLQFARDVIRDGRIPHRAAGTLYGIAVQHEIASPTPDEAAKWDEEIRRTARERWGIEDAARRLKRVEAFVNMRPTTLGKVGKHPTVVLALAEAANHDYSLRIAPSSLRKQKKGG